MVSDSYSCHNFGEKNNQDIFLSDTLIDELVTLDAFLQEQPSYGDISLTESIAVFSRICTDFKHAGIIHLLLGYKEETVWLYTYFIRQEQKKLVFLPCSSDPMREVLIAASTIKNYLQSILSSIPCDGVILRCGKWSR
jgi:hypothetical protein